jgi:hypothetical protein
MQSDIFDNMDSDWLKTHYITKSNTNPIKAGKA